ncbi:hypothetical protein [Spirillospora sp. NPDC047279]|uniref:hypothetical protein n=1 Tax=Spirillospora sp. NPDC047279 TaxID=3155478 RepID=UPI0033C4519F
MLADASPVGANALLIAGPIVLALALVGWLFLTWRGKRKMTRRPEHKRDRAAERGPVSGGMIEGDPAQRNSRHEAPRRS